MFVLLQETKCSVDANLASQFACGCIPEGVVFSFSFFLLSKALQEKLSSLGVLPSL